MNSADFFIILQKLQLECKLDRINMSVDFGGIIIEAFKDGKSAMLRIGRPRLEDVEENGGVISIEDIIHDLTQTIDRPENHH